ncbi:MAG: type I restriction endonuclease subunit R, partial [Proteobacteria bacterium]
MHGGPLTLNFDEMNETDVREIVVRPLLHRLGYQHGTQAHIRTEVTLRYDRAFLGRKNVRKDPALVGRADYICEVVSYGRWVVEVKSPQEALDIESAQQAHTYAAHPEIAADYMLLTNGRKFQLFRVGRLDSPLLEWEYSQLEEKILPLHNIVGPEAIKKSSQKFTIDTGKPLGKGLSSRVSIIGGAVTYEDHRSNTPIFSDDSINGLKLPVTSGHVSRADDGRIHAYIEIGKAGAIFRDIGEIVGISDDYDFFSSDEYVSDDPENPTVFQNFHESITPAGKMTQVPGFGAVPMPFGFVLKAYTEAVGFISEGVFKGTMRLEYDIAIIGLTPTTRQMVQSLYGDFPE